MRRVILLVICLALMLSPASAHSGGTDSKGGHYDRSTGEYHYHHGHPEHQHDGGVCPYDYDDNTKPRSISSESRKRDPSSGTTTKQSNKGAIIMLKIIAVLFTCGFFWTIVANIVDVIQKKKAEKEKKAQREHYERLYQGKHPIQCVNVPEESMVDEDGLPRDIFKRGVEPWGPTYTVFTSMHGTAFHKREGCCGAYFETHIYYARNRHTPCKKCNPTIPDLSWYEEYLRIKHIKSIYIID